MNGKAPAKAVGYKTGVHIQVSSPAMEDLTGTQGRFTVPLLQDGDIHSC